MSRNYGTLSLSPSALQLNGVEIDTQEVILLMVRKW